MTMNRAPISARGIVFCGSLTSSPAVDTASRPMKEKKMVPAAVATPAAPSGAKSAKWLDWNAVKAMIENITSTVSLMTTMIALTLADSLAPRISRNMQSTVKITAGRLITPVVCPGSPRTVRPGSPAAAPAR